MYLHRFHRCRDVFVNQYDNNLLNGFRRFFEPGKLELITCGATHGFLPLMTSQPQRRAGPDRDRLPRVRAPLRPTAPGHLAARVRLRSGRRRDPARLRHPLLLHRHARRAVRRAAAHVRRLRADRLPQERRGARWRATPNRPSRSGAPSKAIPAIIVYREFYRDVGFDLDYDYLKPHLHPTGIRTQPGHQVLQDHRPRASTRSRTTRRPPWSKAAEHAGNFMFNREKQVEWLAGAMDRPAA